jgi:hypothetical protein
VYLYAVYCVDPSLGDVILHHPIAVSQDSIALVKSKKQQDPNAKPRSNSALRNIPPKPGTRKGKGSPRKRPSGGNAAALDYLALPGMPGQGTSPKGGAGKKRSKKESLVGNVMGDYPAYMSDNPYQQQHVQHQQMMGSNPYHQQAMSEGMYVRAILRQERPALGGARTKRVRSERQKSQSSASAAEAGRTCARAMLPACSPRSAPPPLPPHPPTPTPPY